MMKSKNNFFVVFVLFLSCIFLLVGCETLRRKFTRKKKRKQPEEEMIIVPRDYSAYPFANDVLYKQYFVYWKSWNQELVASLNDLEPYKKTLMCIEQAGINIKKMATYLNSEKAAELQVYVKKTQDLEEKIIAAKTMPPARMRRLKYEAERILSAVNRNFDLRRVKDFLKPQQEDEDR